MSRTQGIWSALTFDEIEAWRTSQNKTKAEAASLLGVTNSTYHNWKRGNSVPGVGTQERIKERIKGILDGAAQGEPRAQYYSPLVVQEDVGLEAVLIEATASIVGAYIQAYTPGYPPEETLLRFISKVRHRLETGQEDAGRKEDKPEMRDPS